MNDLNTSCIKNSLKNKGQRGSVAWIIVLGLAAIAGTWWYKTHTAKCTVEKKQETVIQTSKDPGSKASDTVTHSSVKQVQKKEETDKK